MPDPSNIYAIEELVFRTGFQGIEPVEADGEAIVRGAGGVFLSATVLAERFIAYCCGRWSWMRGNHDSPPKNGRTRLTLK